VLAQPSGRRGPASTCLRHVAERACHHLARCGGGAVAVAARAPVEDEQRARQCGTRGGSPCRLGDRAAEAKLGGGASGGRHSDEEGMGVGRRCAEGKKRKRKGVRQRWGDHFYSGAVGSIGGGRGPGGEGSHVMAGNAGGGGGSQSSAR
jgi:hypothetical protein